jgi:hypothetical protein
VLCSLAAAGCGASAPGPPLKPSPASPTPSPLPAVNVAELPGLAAAGAQAAYTATYLLLRSGTGAPDRVTVYRLAAGLRLDIMSTAETATAIFVHGSAYSCVTRNGHVACYSTRGSLPAYLDPGLEKVFGSYLSALATRTAAYTVVPAGHTAASGVRPLGDCFRISGGPPGGVAAGLYCLAADGVPTYVSYRTGALELLSISGPPAPTVLAPPRSPTPLP